MEKDLLHKIVKLWQGYLKIPAIILVWIYIGYQSFSISNQFGGTDLRARVAGARLLFTEKSPYFYSWKPGDPEQWMDPNMQPGRKLNGNVATPALLWLMQPLVWLPYKAIRPIWTLLELLAAGLTICCLSGKKKGSEMLSFSLIPALLLLAGPYWQYHVDRGQLYIFYTALIAGSWYLYKKGKQWVFWSGLVAGLLVYLRPFAICFALPFLATQNKGWLKGFTAGILAGILVWVLPLQQSWKDYAKAMKMYSAELRGLLPKEKAPAPLFPAKVEEMENLRAFGDYHINAFPTTHEIAQKWGQTIPQWVSYGLLALFMGVLTTLVIRKKIREPSGLFTFGFLLMMACEYATHAPRAPYNLLMWLAPVCLLLAPNRFEGSKPKWILVAFLFLCLHPAFTFQKSFGYVGEALLLGVGLAFIFSKQRGKFAGNDYLESSNQQSF